MPRDPQPPSRSTTLASILVVALLAVGALGAVAFVATRDRAPRPVVRYSVPDTRAYQGKGYSITPPEGWKRKRQPGTEVLFLGPVRAGFAGNINVIRERIGTTTLRTYVQAARRLYPKLFNDYRFLGQSSTTVDGLRAANLDGTFKQGRFRIRIRQLVVVSDQVAYIVTATALKSTWTRYSTLFERSLASLTIQ